MLSLIYNSMYEIRKGGTSFRLPKKLIFLTWTKFLSTSGGNRTHTSEEIGF